MSGQNKRYVDIADQIRDEIVNSAENTFLPSERELAERFSAERLTVRRALKLLAEEGIISTIPGKGSLISPGVRPAAARVVKANGSSSILFILSGLGETMKQPFVANLYNRLDKLCYQQGYSLQYVNIGYGDSVQNMTKAMGEVSGVIFYSRIDMPFISAARELGVPMVLLSNKIEGLPGIVYDNINGCYDAVTHLIENGCRHIAFIGGPPEYLNSVQRLEGYRRSLAVHQMEYDERLVINGDWDFESGFACITRLIENDVAFDGVMASNDTMALGAMRALSQYKIRVPRDVKIVGFDNIESGVYSIPSLSSVSFSTKTVTWLAMTMLKSIMEGRPTADSLMLPTQLIVRESSQQ